MYSVHKETITTTPNAKPGREALKPDIIGMEGVPEDAIRGHAEAGSDEEVRGSDLFSSMVFFFLFFLFLL